MKKILMFAWTLGIGVLCQAVYAAPKSGFLHTATYAVNQEGQVVGQKGFTRIWFSGINTLIETWSEKQLTGLMIDGDSPKTFFHKAGRYMDTPTWHQRKIPYPEQARLEFPIYSKGVPIPTNLKGVPCWKYSWHEPERPTVGCMGGAPAHDVTYWIYADKEFPAVLQYESSLGSRSELIEFKINCPISADTFKETGTFKPILPFKLPLGSFTLEITEERVSKENPTSKSTVTETFKGDGKQIIRTYSSITNHGDGRETTFRGNDQTFPYERFGYLNQLLTLSLWGTVKKVGQEMLPLGQADILEGIDKSPSQERYWIVDEPVWGSIVAQKVSDSQRSVVTRRITKLETSNKAVE